MINIRTILLLAVLISMPLSSHAAGDVAAGKAKAAPCAACHGAEGISPTDIWPNLAGQKMGYLIKQLKAFRDGDRKDPVMSPMATGLSDDDIANLAAYYSSL
ncbi:MAG: cytochrome c [Gammaproteobacteria bacterium]